MRDRKAMRSVAIVVALIVAAVVAIFGIFIGNPFSIAPSPPPYVQNQILFAGAGFNQTTVPRNSTIVGSLAVNFTEPSVVQFSLGEEKYYPPGSTGNGTAFSLVDTFQTGSVLMNAVTYNFVPVKDCIATAASSSTIGDTVIENASCNASTVTPVIGTGRIQVSSSGIRQFGYSLQVPSNASLGTYLVDIYIQSQSLENFGNLSNNLVYVLAVDVT